MTQIVRLGQPEANGAWLDRNRPGKMWRSRSKRAEGAGKPGETTRAFGAKNACPVKVRWPLVGRPNRMRARRDLPAGSMVEG